jgi:hypothetical protein
VSERDATPRPRWWSVRRVASSRAASYRCPFCGELLHATSDHVLIAPEGDTRRRRHAHLECTLAERRAGRLPLREERATPETPTADPRSRIGRLARLVRRA